MAGYTKFVTNIKLFVIMIFALSSPLFYINVDIHYNIYPFTPITQKKTNMDFIQNIIDLYIHNLSSQDYHTFNSDIYIQNIKFNHLSFDLMQQSMFNKTMFIYGDSLCRNLWTYLLFSFFMHSKYILQNGTF